MIAKPHPTVMEVFIKENFAIYQIKYVKKII